MLMKKLAIWTVVLVCLSCNKEVIPEPFHNDREVIAVFPPEGIEAHSFSGLVYQGLYRVTDSLKVLFRPVLPMTYDEGLRTISQLTKYRRDGMKRLIIVADPTYADDMERRGINDEIQDTDSNKVVVLGAYANHPKLHNAYIPPYGMMYKAGYIAGMMEDVDSVKLFLATEKYSFYKEAAEGFIRGYQQSGKTMISVEQCQSNDAHQRNGFSASMLSYVHYAPEYDKSYDLVMPICRETAMGFIRYNRENPDAFYTIGMDFDMSDYSKDIPYSCVSRWELVASAVVEDWNNNRLERSRKYSLKEGVTGIVAAEKYQEIIRPLSEEIHNEAIQKEIEYIR